MSDTLNTIHDRLEIDEELIVSVINTDLAPLKAVIEELLKKY